MDHDLGMFIISLLECGPFVMKQFFVYMELTTDDVLVAKDMNWKQGSYWARVHLVQSIKDCI